MPSDVRVDNVKAIESLKKRGCKDKDLKIVQEFFDGRELYDFSGYSGVATILAINDNPSVKNYCVKICDAPFGLKRSYIMMKLMAKHNLSPKVIEYMTTNKDYLITECIEYPMAINAFDDFRSLATFMGRSLRKFHDTQWDFDSMTHEEKYELQKKGNLIFNEAISHERGLSFLAQYQNDFEFAEMKKFLLDHKDVYMKDDVIIHGDFNPRNVFVNNDELGAVVDLEDTCFGDRHYDIYFSMWATALYSGIVEDKKLLKECERIFLESYGIDKIDVARMEYCKKLACMYWQEQNDINGLI